MEPTTHWTADSIADFVYRISSDFVAQLETKLEEKSMTRKEYARALDVTPARVSQFLNDPGSFELSSMVSYAKPLGMKISVVAYDDGDSGNDNGPISSQVFNTCWARCGSPHDMFQAAACTSGVAVLNIAATENNPMICILGTGTSSSPWMGTGNAINATVNSVYNVINWQVGRNYSGCNTDPAVGHSYQISPPSASTWQGASL